MCGIAGIYSKEAGNFGHSIQMMTDSLIHRGPDGHGFFQYNKLTRLKNYQAPKMDQAFNLHFGHRRLSIIDIDASSQPLSNEDGTVWITFNGEIYNYKELRMHLQSSGHVFKTNGDTEVIVHLWEEYGTHLLEKLTGMFALAIYDSNSDQLFCARDRLGQKPFYYYYKEDHFFTFASELQGLYHFPSFPINSLNFEAVFQYFQYGYIPSPSTIFKNVFSLPAGHYILIKNNRLHLHRYWQPNFYPQSEIDLNTIESLLSEAVKSQLVSDVPIGSFLSGGIDSSLISYFASRNCQTPFNTFNVSQTHTKDDESIHAQHIADHLKTTHFKFEIAPDFSTISEKLALHYGQPFADYSQIPTYLVCQKSRSHIKVALSGDGGDEFFGGYDRYKNYALNHALHTMSPSLIKKYILKPLSHVLSSKFKSFNVFDFLLSTEALPYKGEQHSNLFVPYLYSRIFSHSYFEHARQYCPSQLNRFSQLYFNTTARSPLEKWMEVDQQMYLPDNILVKMDIASMAASLECRAPFLDHRLVEYVNASRLAGKIHHGQTKYALRMLAKKYLPKGIAALPKKGFSIPLGMWMKTTLKHWTEHLLFLENSPLNPLIDQKELRSLWSAHLKGTGSHTLRLWSVMQFNLWHKSISEFKKNIPHVKNDSIILETQQAAPKKMLMVIDSLAQGGAEYQFLKLANHMSEKFNVAVVLTARKDKLYSDLNLAHIRQVYCFNKTHSFELWSLFCYLRSLLKFSNPTVVDSWLFYSMFLIRFTAPKNIALISHLRSSLLAFNEEEPRFLFRAFKNILLKNTLRHSHRVVTNSVSNQKKLLHELKHPNVSYIPNFIRLTPTVHSIRKSNDMSNLHIIFVGRLVEEKGIFVLLEALNSLYSKNIKFTATFIGSGPCLESLKSKIHSLQLEDLISVAGHMDHMEELYTKSDILILPSFSEGMPNVLLEAMAFSLLVIASDIPGINDIITHKENGLLFKKGDSDNLCHHIEYLLNHPGEASTLKKNASMFASQFSEERFLSSHLDLYRDFLKGLDYPNKSGNDS